MSDHRHKASACHEGSVGALARWVLSIGAGGISADAMAQAKLLVLDSIGCGLAGRETEVGRSVLRPSGGMGVANPCTVIGGAARTDMLTAVLANGVLVRVLDLNDYVVGMKKGAPEIGGHPSDNIPSALAVGEACGSSGRDVLAAIAVGYELYGRLKSLMDRRGPWDGVSVSGIVAPAVAGRLMGLDEERLAHAIALGGTRAATPAIVRQGGISAAKSIANALVAQSGVQAALLAEQGVTGPLAILDDERGLKSVFPKDGIAAILTAPFPATSYIMRANVKAYPCLATGQCAVAAALELHAALGANAHRLERIDVIMADYPFILRQQQDSGRMSPASREAADHSFNFLIAVSLIDGAFGTAQFAGERWNDPAIKALMARMTMRADAALNERAPGAYPCAIRAWDRDGRDYGAEALFPPGYSRNGIEESAVVEKFHRIAAAAFDRTRRERVVRAVMDLDRSTALQELSAAIAA
jgi:2-methylcitrate dehydratase